MKSLVIAEKPSVARDIARVLHCSQKGNGTLEGKDYVVTWALGHLVTLADPEEYDKKYTKWELSNAPHDAGENETGGDTPDLQAVQCGENPALQEGYRRDHHATDAGREGELVARWSSGEGGLP